MINGVINIDTFVSALREVLAVSHMIVVDSDTFTGFSGLDNLPCYIKELVKGCVLGMLMFQHMCRYYKRFVHVQL